MQAAVLRGVREQAIEDIDIDAPGPKEVVIKVAAAGVCHSDLHFYNGTWHVLRPSINAILTRSSAFRPTYYTIR